MIIRDQYKTLSERSTGQFKDRGSKFIAIASRVFSIEEALSFVDEIKKEYHDARHHCYAYKIGIGDDQWRVNDDGEPSGSAGNPILGQIKSFEITNVCIVVVRYFGGTLLGVGGLINAYRTAAREALSSADIVTRHIKSSFLIEFPYSHMNSVMKILKEDNIEQSRQRFELDCSLVAIMPKSITEKVLGLFDTLEGLKYTFITDEF